MRLRAKRAAASVKVPVRVQVLRLGVRQCGSACAVYARAVRACARTCVQRMLRAAQFFKECMAKEVSGAAVLPPIPNRSSRPRSMFTTRCLFADVIDSHCPTNVCYRLQQQTVSQSCPSHALPIICQIMAPNIYSNVISCPTIKRSIIFFPEVSMKVEVVECRGSTPRREVAVWQEWCTQVLVFHATAILFFFTLFFADGEYACGVLPGR